MKKLALMLALLTIVGCASDDPPAWAMSPWGYAVKTCNDKYDPGYEQTACVADTLDRLDAVRHRSHWTVRE